MLTSSNLSAGACVCPCTADDLKTPLVNEDTCPGADADKFSVCGTFDLAAGQASYCVKTCQPRLKGSDCAAPLRCDPRSGAVIRRHDLALCLYSGRCAKDSDCPVTTGASCDSSRTPTGCKIGETCAPLYTHLTAGRCTTPGKCDKASGLCGPHTLGDKSAKVGDPCKSDLDCGGHMACQMELDESKYLLAAGKACKANGECCSGTCQGGVCAQGRPCRVLYRSGYCATLGCTFAKTLNEATCDGGSACDILHPGGACLKTCDLKQASTCRGHKNDELGDYECRAWNHLSVGGVTIASKPVCEAGYGMPCDLLAGSGFGCSSVGLQGNPTKMSCRDDEGAALTNKYDPAGLCLDDTVSGP